MNTNTIHEGVRERIRELLKDSRTSVNRLERMTGISQRTLQNQINEGVKISLSTILSVLEYYEKINPSWLLFGRPHPKYTPTSYVIPDKEVLGTGENEIQYFRLTEEYRGENIAHDLSEIKEMGMFKNNEKVILSMNNFYAPVIPAGCYIFMKQIEEWKKLIEFGRIYYIKLKDHRDFFAIIKPNDKPGTWKLIPLNERSAPMILPHTMIANIWLVCRKIEEM